MSTPESSEIERLRAAFDSLGDDAEWPDADAERVFAALHGDATVEERRALVDELVRNPRAAVAWRLARELAPDAAAARPVAPPETDSGGRWVWMSLAAMLLLTLSAVWHFEPFRTETPVYRSGERRAIASALQGDAALPRGQPVLRWTAIEGARYRVRVLSEELDVLVESDDLEAAVFRLPPDVVDRIAPGATFLWQVEARAAGADLVVSPTFSTRLE